MSNWWASDKEVDNSWGQDDPLADAPTPEPRRDLDAQALAVKERRKPALYLPEGGTPTDSMKKLLAPAKSRYGGTYWVDRDTATADIVKVLDAEDRMGPDESRAFLLQYPDPKPKLQPTAKVVEGRDARGGAVYQAGANDPGTAIEAATVQAGPGGSVAVKSLDEILQDREDQTALEQAMAQDEEAPLPEGRVTWEVVLDDDAEFPGRGGAGDPNPMGPVGLIDATIAGAGELANTIYTGWKAMLAAAYAYALDDADYGEAFTDILKDQTHASHKFPNPERYGASGVPAYLADSAMWALTSATQAKTDTGNKILNKMGEIFTAVVTGAGDKVFETTGSPAAGAATQGVLAAGPLAIGLKKPSAATQTKRLHKALEGKVGEVRPAPWESPEIAVNRKLASMLGKEPGDLTGVTLKDRIRMVIDQSDPKGEWPAAVRGRVAAETAEAVQAMSAAKTAREKLALPNNVNIQDGRVIATPTGAAWREGTILSVEKAVWDQMTAEQRATVLGHSTEGRLKQAYVELQKREAIAADSGSRADMAKVQQAKNELKRRFASYFDRVPTERRTAALEAYIESGGELPVSTLLEMTGKRRAPQSEGGWIQLEGAERSLADAVDRFKLAPIPGSFDLQNGQMKFQYIGRRSYRSDRDAVYYNVHHKNGNIAGLSVHEDPATGVPVAISSIDAYGSAGQAKHGAGVGEGVLFSLLTRVPPDRSLELRTVLPEAYPFWKRMGAKYMEGASADDYPHMSISMDAYIKARDADRALPRDRPVEIQLGRAPMERGVPGGEERHWVMNALKDPAVRDKLTDAVPTLDLNWENSMLRVQPRDLQALESVLQEELRPKSIWGKDPEQVSLSKRVRDARLNRELHPPKAVKPGQEGAIKIEGVEPTAEVRRAAKATASAGPASGADEFQAMLDRSKAAESAARSTSAKKVLDMTKGKVIDHHGPLMSKLTELGAQNAVDDFRLRSGAHARAKLQFDKVDDVVFKGLSTDMAERLSAVVKARRHVQLGRYKGGDWELKGAVAEQWLAKQQNEPWFAAIQSRADRVFDAYKDQLKQLRDEGLLNEEGYVKMQNFDYEPTQYIDMIDPVSLRESRGGKMVSVRESGVEDLKVRRPKSLEELNARELLAEHIVRVQGRIMNNRANQSLRQFALDHPNNGFVKVPDSAKFEWDAKGNLKTDLRTPEGHVRVDARVDGRQYPVFMQGELGHLWATKPQPLSFLVDNIARIVSGTSLVKSLATTYNPAFVLTNMPRDLLHIYLASDQMSPHLPVYGVQMGANLAKVAGDAWRRTGLYEEWIQHGGGMDFLTQQGRDTLWASAHSMGEKIGASKRSVEKTKKALSYVNEFSEVWTRLAVYRKAKENAAAEAMKRGEDPAKPAVAERIMRDAAARSREYIDFSRGAELSRAADAVIPYFNAAMTGLTAVVHAAKTDPARFSTASAWFLATDIALLTYSMQTNPDAWKQVSEFDKMHGAAITMPNHFFTHDPQGNKRWPYFTLRVDPAVVPLHTAAVTIVERALLGKQPSAEYWDTAAEALTSLSPVGGNPIPAIAALSTYTSNHDFWRDQTIWTGPDVDPSQEFTDLPGRPTPEAWKDFGDITGLSPARSEAAAKAVLPGNFYVDTILQAEDLLVSDEYRQAQTLMQLIANTPMADRVFKLTHPVAAEADRLDKTNREVNTRRIEWDRSVDKLIFRMLQGKDSKVAMGQLQADLDKAIRGGGTDLSSRPAIRQMLQQSGIDTLAQSAPAEDRRRLVEDFRDQVKTELVLRGLKASEGIPSRYWWLRAKRMSVEAKAAEYNAVWQSASPENRKRMDIVARQLGFYSADFRRALLREREVSGVQNLSTP